MSRSAPALGDPRITPVLPVRRRAFAAALPLARPWPLSRAKSGNGGALPEVHVGRPASRGCRTTRFARKSDDPLRDDVGRPASRGSQTTRFARMSDDPLREEVRRPASRGRRTTRFARKEEGAEDGAAALSVGM